MTSALLFIDVQRNMLIGRDAIPDAARIRPALEALLARARAAGATIVHVQNEGPPGSVDEPHTDGWKLVAPAADGEIVVGKDEADTFAANPKLADELRRLGVQRVVVAGMQSEMCVQATGETALREGFEVIVAGGAHATYDDGRPATDISAQAERELSDKGAQVRPADEVVFA
jgi:nicotinamidase-related amidase